PFPAEIISEPHAVSRITFHSVDAAVSRAGAGGNNGPRARREFVDPLAGCDRLSGFAIGSKRRPVPLSLVVFVWYRAFDVENKRIDAPVCFFIKHLDNLIGVLERKKGVVKTNCGNPGNPAEKNLLGARLRARGNRNRIPAKTNPRRYPEDIDLSDRFCR